MTETGAYAFWPQHQHPQWMDNERINADIDDTTIITEVLYKFGRISKHIVKNTLVQMNAYKVDYVDSNDNAWAECNTYHTWMIANNDIGQLDCCVNTNALIVLALAEKQNTPAYHSIIRMLNNALHWSNNEYNKIRTLTPYYAHPNEWLETLIYARSCGVQQLSGLIDSIRNKWTLPPACKATPLYCRHDGQYLWTSSYLTALRRTF